VDGTADAVLFAPSCVPADKEVLQVDVSSTATKARGTWARWEPLSGIAFVVLFIATWAMFNPPNEDASDAEWHNYFADRGHQIATTISAFLMVFAGLALMAFFTTVWSRIAAVRRPDTSSPLSLVSAGVAGTCLALGGVCLATVTGAMLFGSLREPGADVLRLSGDLFFPFVAVAGMYAASLSVATLTIQGFSAGVFGKKLRVLGLVVAVGLLASFVFFPMVLLLIWAIVVTIVLMRRGTAATA
jgi:hypothetical protein